jgi:curved DNA-binding protein CbpA
MPPATFRGDPYAVLGVSAGATNSAIKRRWRELAREHHPDRAAGDGAQAERLTERMARINAAYDLLRDPLRRADYDRAAGRSSWVGGAARRSFDAEPAEEPAGPPPPPAAPPVTARFDMTSAFRPRNTTLGGSPSYGSGRPSAPPRMRRAEPEDLRASTPSGPVERRRVARPPATPSLQEARETTLAFGKYRGYTLGELELLEPTYIDWIAQTITRDRDLVVRARVIQAELDQRGVERRVRPASAAAGGGGAGG